VKASRVLLRPREPAFWVYVALLAVTAAGTFAQQSSFRRISPGGWALSWVLLLLYAAPVFILIYLLDLYEREPIPLLLASFLWGAIVATQLAGFANAGWGLVVARVGGPEFASRWTAALTAPLVEETLKGLGVVLIVLIARREIDDMMDGFVYGAVCGLGFAVVEDVFYFIVRFGGSPEAVLLGFFVRVIASGLYSHVLWSGLFGIGVGYFVGRKGEVSLGRRLWMALGLIAAAVVGHFLWNSPLLDLFPRSLSTGVALLQVLGAAAVKGLPLLAVVGVMVVLARRREHRWLRAALVSEVGREGILEEEMAVLANPRRRRRARRDLRRRAGPSAAAMLKRFHKAQVNLAMIATRVPGDDHPDLLNQRRYCRALREALVVSTSPLPSPPSGTTASA
jgi:RsiW-degrading membrane proteinase PrsW (M82 family)